MPEYTLGDIVKILDRHDPGIITINAVISALQSHEAIKILHWNGGQKGLGKPINSYVVYNGITMKFYHINKTRNPECSQCGKNVRRININIKSKSPCVKIIDALKEKGYNLDPELEPVITLMDSSDIKVLDLDQNCIANDLRNYELFTVGGFLGGEIYVTLEI